MVEGKVIERKHDSPFASPQQDVHQPTLTEA